METSWNTIFRLIAPYLIDKADEKEIERLLERSFKDELEEIARTEKDLDDVDWNNPPEVKRIDLKNSDLKTIIVQLGRSG